MKAPLNPISCILPVDQKCRTLCDVASTPFDLDDPSGICVRVWRSIQTPEKIVREACALTGWHGQRRVPNFILAHVHNVT